MVSCNAYTLGYQGVVKKGLKLQFDHPLLPGKLACFLNDPKGWLKYVGVHSHYERAVERRDGEAALYRVAISERISKYSNKKFYLLECPTADTQEMYLHVSFMLPTAARLKINRPQHFGIDGSATVVTKTAGEALVSFIKDGDELLVYYPDGLVSRVWRDAGELHSEVLPSVEIAVARVALAKLAIERANLRENHDDRQRAIDGIDHSLMTLLELSAGMPKDDRRPITDFFADRYGTLGVGVVKKLESVLSHIGDREAWYMISAPALATNVVQLPSARKAKGGSKKAERSARDREVRSRMKGSSGGKK